MSARRRHARISSETGRVLRRALSCAGAVAMALIAVAPASARPVRTVVAFDASARQTPENLAIADDGTIYVSLAFASEIRRIAPNGQQTTLTMPTHGGITVGVAIDRHHGGDLDVAVRSTDPAAAGIWRVSRKTFARPRRIAPLPPASFPNGITFDRSGNLYIADSTLGQIWRLAPGASRPKVWCKNELLAPTGASFMNFPLPGANGIKIWHDEVYVSNTSTQTILAIPIERHGEPERPAVQFRGVQADDFAFAADGEMYIALNPLSELIRVTAKGARQILATHAYGLQNTSAVAFDPRPGRRRHLFITNSSYFGTTPTLQETTANTVGLPLP